MSFSTTVDLQLRPSVGLLKLALALHVAVMGLLLVALPRGLPMALAAALVGASWLYIRRHPALGFGPKAVTRVLWDAEGAWQIATASGPLMPVQLHRQSLVTQPLLGLRFIGQRGELHRLITARDTDASSLHRLRARLLSSGPMLVKPPSSG